MATTETSVTITIYAIDRDNGDGRYVRRHSFAPLAAATVNHASTTDPRLADYQDTEGGLAVRIWAPAGTRVEDGLLVLPDVGRLTADQALSAARSKPWESFGLAIA